MPFTPDDPSDDILDHERVNDGIRYIHVKDNSKSYELYEGEWVEAYDGDLADEEYELSIALAREA